MPKLLLIHPATTSHTKGFGDTSSLHMPPLALAYVAAATPDDWHIQIVDEYVERVRGDEPADLVGITAYTTNIVRAYELAHAYRVRGIPVVLGGIHVSMCPEEGMLHADSVVVGEAEGIWSQVLDDFRDGALQARYDGGLTDLSAIPVPRRDLLPGHYDMDVIQTSRGCPFSCDFCSVTAFNKGSYRQRPIAQVVAEFASLESGVAYIIDDNLLGVGGDARDRAFALFTELAKVRPKKLWASQVSLNIADDEKLLRKAYEAGCRILYIGFESLDDKRLKEMRKGANVRSGVSGYTEQIRSIHRHGIAVFGSFMIGLDGDTGEDARQVAPFADKSGIDVLDLSYLTPYPGTELHARMVNDNRIIFGDFPRDWEQWDATNVVFVPSAMSIVELVHGYDHVIRSFLNMPSILIRTVRTAVRTRSFAAALLSFNMNMGQRVALNYNRTR
jgi:radical SAM superfamily enzyme YgiQ (UPF0313 family)